MRRPHIKFLLLAALISVFAGCKPKEAPVDAWYVVERRDSRWTLIHTDHTNRRQLRYVVTCGWYQWGNHQSVPGGCDLPVGRILVWNGLPDKQANFVDIWILADNLFITEGDGDDRVSQGFIIQTSRTEPIDPHLPTATRPRTLADTMKQ